MSLQVWLPLIQDIRNQGIMDVNIVNNNVVTDTGGKFGPCFWGETAANNITCTNDNLLDLVKGTVKYSISCWVQVLQSQGHVIQIGSINPVGLYLRSDSWAWVDSGNDKMLHGFSTFNWHHIIVTVDQSNISNIKYTCYYDGEKTAELVEDGESKLQPSGNTIILQPYFP